MSNNVYGKLYVPNNQLRQLRGRRSKQANNSNDGGQTAFNAAWGRSASILIPFAGTEPNQEGGVGRLEAKAYGSEICLTGIRCVLNAANLDCYHRAKIHVHVVLSWTNDSVLDSWFMSPFVGIADNTQLMHSTVGYGANEYSTGSEKLAARKSYSKYHILKTWEITLGRDNSISPLSTNLNNYPNQPGMDSLPNDRTAILWFKPKKPIRFYTRDQFDGSVTANSNKEPNLYLIIHGNGCTQNLTGDPTGPATAPTAVTPSGDGWRFDKTGTNVNVSHNVTWYFKDLAT